MDRIAEFTEQLIHQDCNRLSGIAALLTKEQMQRQNDLWIHDLQAQEAALSTNGKQIIVPDSGHMIPYERPDVIISEVHDVWSAIHTSN